MNINNRIQQIIDKLGITAYEFSKKLGNKRPDGIYALLKEGSEIKPSPKTLDKIRETFPEINYIWLLTGEGEMRIGNNKEIANLTKTKKGDKFEDKQILIEKMELFKPVPFYNINVSAGNVTFLDDGLLKNQQPDDFMFVPKNIDADIAFPTFGHSMYPEISNGDRVAYKLIKDWSFFNYGMKYLIITDEQRMVKYLKRHEKEGYVLLESRNKEFEPIDMPISSIRAILQVRYIGKIEM